mgnify:FL=1
MQSEFRAQKAAELKEEAQRAYQERKEKLKERKEVMVQNHRVEKELQVTIS